VPAAPKTETAVAAKPPTSANGPAPAASSAATATARREPGAATRAEERAEAKLDPAGEGKADAKGDTRADTKSETRAAKASPRAEQDASKARALLEGKPAEAAAAAASAPASEARYVVQVGAFADAAKAQDMRQKVERSGLKTYTHVAETKEGKRTRVRVGPFATRSEADKAAARIKGLDLPAAVLTL
jgi:DedD protein